jgi:hypothetical protein
MPRRSKPQHPQITRDLRRIRALTPHVTLPDIDAETRQRLRAMTQTARNRLDSGDLHGALSVMCEAQ